MTAVFAITIKAVLGFSEKNPTARLTAHAADCGSLASSFEVGWGHHM